MQPKSAVIAVTYKCNSRCTMCDIWMKEIPPEVDASFYRNLPASLRQVNLSGGEPLLRNDLPEIIDVIQRTCPGVRIVISTNGLQPKRTAHMLRGRTEIGVRVSVDGIGETHDTVRGIPGNFQKCLETIDLLQEAGLKDLGLSYTVSTKSEPQLLRVKRLADERGIEFTCSVVHSSAFFFGEQSESVPRVERHIEELERLMREQLASRRPKEWFRAYYTDGLIRKLRGQNRKLPCYGFEEMFYLDPYGNVYPCNILDKPIGKLGEKSYTELVVGAHETLEYVRKCPVQCWMVCTAAPAMRRDVKVPSAWVLREKLAPRRRRAPEPVASG
jgi:MoaA/NifB/PqqE/SkfB family radical SAM enzyme